MRTLHPGELGIAGGVPLARLLTVNGGSSSIKCALYEVRDGLHQTMRVKIERIGLSGTMLSGKGAGPEDVIESYVAAADHRQAIQRLLDWLEKHTDTRRLTAIGHRIVHGGPAFRGPARLTAQVLAELRRLGPLDPEHLPAELLAVEELAARLPEVPQFACFDTAFHHDLPPVAGTLPIPRRYREMGVRRYGFHGLSYSYLLRELARRHGEMEAKGRVILAHLGHGASLAAVRGGRSIDTSMSLTPTAGLVMGSRSGDIDPGLIAFLARTEGMSVPQFEDMVNFHSGLLGISETSSDVRDLLELETTDLRAAEALELFCYQAKKWIGAYAAALGGLDSLVFAGGIGENCAQVRGRICHGLAFLGIELDAARNPVHAGVISADGSRVTVHVIHTDEELMLAEGTCEALGIAA